MRFDASSSTPPPLVPSWRIILWAMTLVPALLILGWSLRQARLPKPDFDSGSIAAKDVQRLQRILKEPRDEATPSLPDGTVRVVATSADSIVGETSQPQLGRDVRIDKAILLAIKDNTFGITASEKPAYDAILAKSRNTPLSELEPLAHEDIPFALLMLDSDRFRGEIVTLEGDVRRLNPLAESFEAWLFTDDSGLNPYRIVLARLPAGIPMGDELNPPIRVRITGYFFKRFSYATANGFHTAPLLLANTLVPLASSKSAALPPRTNSRSLTILAIGILGTLVVGGLAVEMFARRRSRRGDRRSEEVKDTPPDFSWLNRP